jgi:hypothetical protein
MCPAQCVTYVPDRSQGHQGLFSTVSVGIPLVVSNSFSGIISLDCRTFGFSVAFR